MPYCDKTDLLVGDIPLARKYGDGTGFVQMAADEIDAQLGHIYVTPIVVDTIAHPEYRPTKLILKKINQLLASGRIILDQAAGGEDSQNHVYGQSLVREALGLLNQINSGAMELAGAPLILTPQLDRDRGPAVVQEDSQSLVAGFYDRYSQPVFPGVQFPLIPMRPYE